MASTVIFPKHISVVFFVDLSSKDLPDIFGKYSDFCGVGALGFSKPVAVQFGKESTRIISNEDFWSNPGFSTVSAGHVQIMEVALRSLLDT